MSALEAAILATVSQVKNKENTTLFGLRESAFITGSGKRQITLPAGVSQIFKYMGTPYIFPSDATIDTVANAVNGSAVTSVYNAANQLSLTQRTTAQVVDVVGGAITRSIPTGGSSGSTIGTIQQLNNGAWFMGGRSSAYGNSNGAIRRSTDFGAKAAAGTPELATWTLVLGDLATSSNVVSNFYYGNATYVAMGDGYSPASSVHNIAYSSDGITWTSTGYVTSTQHYTKDVVYFNGQWLYLCTTGSQMRVYRAATIGTSAWTLAYNGPTYDTSTLATQAHKFAVISGRVMFLSGSDVISSTDGTTWAATSTISAGETLLNNSTYGTSDSWIQEWNSYLVGFYPIVVGGVNKVKMIYSSNGTTWSYRLFDFPSTTPWNNDLLFAVYGTAPNQQLYFPGSLYNSGGGGLVFKADTLDPATCTFKFVGAGTQLAASVYGGRGRLKPDTSGNVFIPPPPGGYSASVTVWCETGYANWEDAPTATWSVMVGSAPSPT